MCILTFASPQYPSSGERRDVIKQAKVERVQCNPTFRPGNNVEGISDIGHIVGNS